jgi:hypothetical protein
MSSSIVSPFPFFTDTTGAPLEGGYIYIGQSNLNPETAPVNVFWDAALTIPAAQPVRTVGGYPSRQGTPSRFYSATDTYSITVRNKNRALVFSAFDQSDSPTSVFDISTQLITATAGQLTFALTVFTYLPGTDTLEVYRNGLRLNLNLDYLETNSSTVTLTAPAAAGDQFLFQGGSTVTGNQVPGSQVSFIQAGAGAVTRNMQDKARESVSVLDFGAVGNGVVDDSSSFIAAINSLPAEGGEIGVPAGNYLLNTNPLLSVGTKSIFWNISPGCVFSGTGVGSGKFPYMTTNQFQLAVGPFVQSRTSQTAVDGSGFPNVGVAAFNAEMLQPATYAGQSVGIYVGGQGSNPSVNADSRLRGNVWAINSMIVAQAGAKGIYHNIEADVNNFANPAGDVGGLHKVMGIAIQGIGDYPVHVGLEIARTPYGGQTESTMPKYNRGIHIFHSTVGIELHTTVEKGIVINNPSSGIQTACISAKMLSNGADVINLQRFTDTSSAGYFLRCVNAANNVNLFTLNNAGGIDSQSYWKGTRIEMIATAAPASSGIVSLGADVLANSTAMPSTPPQYWYIYYGGTQYKIPLFLA